jgi:hypothetical protein
MVIKECMLSTIDNPYDPFEQFTSWDCFDHEKGYNSKERLARLVDPHLKEDMTEKEESETIERVIDEIIKYDPLNICIKVVKEVEYEAQPITD